MSIYRRGPVYSSTYFFQISKFRLTKTIWNSLVVLKNHGKMAPVIYIFTLIPLIWFKKNFLICCHFLVVTRYISQHQLLAISVLQKQCQIYLMLRKSIKSDCNNLYLKNRSFKITLKTNSDLASFFCSDSVNPSISLFPISVLQKQLDIYKFSENLSQKLKIKFIPYVDIPSWPGNSVNPNFCQHQSDRNSDKFICFLEI